MSNGLAHFHFVNDFFHSEIKFINLTNLKSILFAKKKSNSIVVLKATGKVLPQWADVWFKVQTLRRAFTSPFSIIHKYSFMKLTKELAKMCLGWKIGTCCTSNRTMNNSKLRTLWMVSKISEVSYFIIQICSDLNGIWMICGVL